MLIIKLCQLILINLIKPWIEDFTKEDNYIKLKNKEYIIVREIKVEKKS